MPNLTFISYSRHQYYFAESLTLHLQQRRLPVWFDLQQIEPGVNWRADIQDGLDRCASVTLVASRTAFRSPYVAREWQAALDAGKPVYVVLYERVPLPKVLRQRGVIIDFRHDFQQGVDRLAGCLADDRDQRVCSGRQPGGWRPGLPRGVRRMAFALALSDVALVGGTFLDVGSLALLMNPGVLPRMLLDAVSPESAAHIAWLVMVGLLILAVAGLVSRQRRWRKAGRFLRHDFEYEDLQKQLQTRYRPGGSLWALGVVGLSYGLWQTDLLGQSGLQADLGIVGLPLLVGLGLAIVLLMLVRFPIRWLTPASPDPDVIRWADLGSVPQAWRIAVNRPLLNPGQAEGEEGHPVEMLLQHAGRPSRIEEVTADSDTMAQRSAVPSDLTVRVVAAAADQAIRYKVGSVITSIGFQKVDSVDEAAHVVLVLTYRTPVALALETLQAARAAGQNVIGVMATNVSLPADLLSLQIIDFRTGSTLQLTSAFRYLRDQSQAARAMFSQQLLPARLADQAPDPDLQGYFEVLGGLVAVIGVVSLWDIARLVLTGHPLSYGGLGIEPVVGLVLVLAALTLPLIWQAMGVLAGRARFPGMVIRLIALVALPVMITAELLGNFPTQGAVPAVEQLITGPASIAAPLLMYLLLCLIIQAPALVTVRDHALGMPRLRPPWKSILYLIAGAAVLILLPSVWK